MIRTINSSVFCVWILVVAGCSLQGGPLLGGAGSNPEDLAILPWHTSYDDAMAEARETGKPILAAFTRKQWCEFCQELDEQVFSKAEFKQWAGNNVVLLSIDFPREPQSQEVSAANKQLAVQFGRFISSYPSVLLIDERGTVIGKLRYTAGGAKQWLRQAELMMGRSVNL